MFSWVKNRLILYYNHTPHPIHLHNSSWTLEQLDQWVLSMVAWKLKLNEEKSKHAGLAAQNAFWPSIFAQFAEAGWRHSRAKYLLLIA